MLTLHVLCNWYVICVQHLVCICVEQSNTWCDDKTGLLADKGKDDKKDKKGQEKDKASK